MKHKAASILLAYMNGELVGEFTKSADSTPHFQYANGHWRV